MCRGFRSRPVSRILSRATIHLCSYPVPRRAASAEPVRLAPDGVWLAAVSPRRWWALTPPFHPYLRQINRRAGKAATTPNGIASEAVERYASGGLLSVPLSVGFRRLGRPSVLPCGVRTFLEPRRARGHPACVDIVASLLSGKGGVMKRIVALACLVGAGAFAVSVALAGHGHGNGHGQGQRHGHVIHVVEHATTD